MTQAPDTVRGKERPSRIPSRYALALACSSLILSAACGLIEAKDTKQSDSQQPEQPAVAVALKQLASLSVKGRAPKTGYSREQFGSDWASVGGCDMRNIILRRDLTRLIFDADDCLILSGVLHDPYTADDIVFTRGVTTSWAVGLTNQTSGHLLSI